MTNLIQQGLALRELLRERILVLDGAMGTMLQQENLTAADFGGPHLEGCNENLVLTRPDVVLGIHRKYLEAGSDLIETNSFGSTPVVLAEYGLGEHARKISRVAGELARKAADEFSKAGKPRFVAGSMGPTTKAISVTGGITFEQLRNNYHEQAAGWWRAARTFCCWKLARTRATSRPGCWRFRTRAANWVRRFR